MSKKIALIESDPAFSQSLRAELERKGFAVVDTQDGKAAFDLVKREQPDLVVLSVELSANQSGYVVCSKLKKDEEVKRIPVIITGRDAEGFESHKRLIKLRAEEYLVKPFDPPSLFEKIAALVGVPESDQAALSLDEDTAGSNASEGHIDGGMRTGDPDLEMLDAAFETISERARDDISMIPNEEPIVALTDDGMLEEPSDIDSTSLYELGSAGDGADPIDARDDKADEDFVLDALDAIEDPAHGAAGGGTMGSPPPMPAVSSGDPELVSLREQAADLGNRVRTLEDLLAQRTNELEAFKAATDGKDKDFFSLREQGTKKDKEILRLKGEVNEKDQRIIELEERQMKLERTNSELSAEITKRDAQIKTFVQRQEAYSAERKKLDASLNQAKDDIRQLSTKLSTAQGELDQTQEALADQTRKLEASRGEVASLNSDLENLRSEHEQLTVAHNDANEKIAILEPEADRAIKLDEEVANLRARIAELEQTVARDEDRLLKAYQKIKLDEDLRARAKKAIENTLEILEENIPLEGDAMPSDDNLHDTIADQAAIAR